MNEDVFVVLISGNLFIGKLAYLDPDGGNGAWEMKDPRALVPVQQGPSGMLTIQVSPVLGNPEVVYFDSGIVYFRPTDRKLLNEYTKAVTGIEIAGSISPRLVK